MSFFHVRSPLAPTTVSILPERPFLYLLFGWRMSFHSFSCLHHSKQFIRSEICETLYIGRKTDDISIRPSDQVEEPSFNTAWWSHTIYCLRILVQLQKRIFVGNRYCKQFRTRKLIASDHPIGKLKWTLRSPEVLFTSSILDTEVYESQWAAVSDHWTLHYHQLLPGKELDSQWAQTRCTTFHEVPTAFISRQWDASEPIPLRLCRMTNTSATIFDFDCFVLTKMELIYHKPIKNT